VTTPTASCLKPKVSEKKTALTKQSTLFVCTNAAAAAPQCTACATTATLQLQETIAAAAAAAAAASEHIVNTTSALMRAVATACASVSEAVMKVVLQ
jgi:hypothetical protein